MKNLTKVFEHEIDNFLSLLSRILNIVLKFNIFLTAFLHTNWGEIGGTERWGFIVIHSTTFVKHWQIGPFIELLEDSLILSQIRFRHFKAEILRSHKKLFLLQKCFDISFLCRSYFKCIFRELKKTTLTFKTLIDKNKSKLVLNNIWPDIGQFSFNVITRVIKR